MNRPIEKRDVGIHHTKVLLCGNGDDVEPPDSAHYKARGHG